jgi:hypothetical protein
MHVSFLALHLHVSHVIFCCSAAAISHLPQGSTGQEQPAPGEKQKQRRSRNSSSSSSNSDSGLSLQRQSNGSVCPAGCCSHMHATHVDVVSHSMSHVLCGCSAWNGQIPAVTGCLLATTLSTLAAAAHVTVLMGCLVWSRQLPGKKCRSQSAVSELQHEETRQASFLVIGSRQNNTENSFDECGNFCTSCFRLIVSPDLQAFFLRQCASQRRRAVTCESAYSCEKNKQTGVHIPNCRIMCMGGVTS